MQDIKLLETCPLCRENLILMESARYSDSSVWLVKRCLNPSCGCYPVTEVIQIRQMFEKQVYGFPTKPATTPAPIACSDLTFDPNLHTLTKEERQEISNRLSYNDDSDLKDYYKEKYDGYGV